MWEGVTVSVGGNDSRWKRDLLKVRVVVLAETLDGRMRARSRRAAMWVTFQGSNSSDDLREGVREHQAGTQTSGSLRVERPPSASARELRTPM